MGKVETSNFNTIGSTIIESVKTLTFLKFLILTVSLSLLFVIYFKYRIKIKNMIKK
jgi:hypothetical protein